MRKSAFVYPWPSGYDDKKILWFMWAFMHQHLECWQRLIRLLWYPGGILKWNGWCFGPWFCTVRIYWARDNMVNEMNFVMNHALGAGLIGRPVDQQSSTLPLYHGRPQRDRQTDWQTDTDRQTDRQTGKVIVHITSVGSVDFQMNFGYETCPSCRIDCWTGHMTFSYWHHCLFIVVL